MSILQYATRVSPDGSITLPPIPEYQDVNVVVTVEKSGKKPLKRKHKATPEEAKRFEEICFGCLAGVSDEEFEKMKMDRILER